MSRQNVTSNATQCRYGLWHSDTCTLSSNTVPIPWRQTPRSKKYVAIVPTMAIPAAMQVVNCSDKYYDLRMHPSSIEHLSRWCNYPDASILPFTDLGNNVVRMQGPCGVQDNTYSYIDAHLQKGQWVMGRVRVFIASMGSQQHKLHVTLVDAVIL